MERQPIGRRLFEDFCRQTEFYRNWMNFLELVNQYELSISDKHKIAGEIRKKFLAQDAPCRLNSTRPGNFHGYFPGYLSGWIKILIFHWYTLMSQNMIYPWNRRRISPANHGRVCRRSPNWYLYKRNWKTRNWTTHTRKQEQKLWRSPRPNI